MEVREKMNQHVINFTRYTLLLLIISLVGCSNHEEQNLSEANGYKKEEMMKDKIELAIFPEKIHQTIESFGASGAWWSQDVGGWTENETEELTKREYIAELLFDKNKGIGLTSYRYNLGAGSTAENSSKITDPWRRAESFELAPGEYDWSRDKKAQWMLNTAVEYGVEDIYLFVNSPPTRLTKNGSAYGTMVDGVSSNLDPENYEAFAKYIYDVSE